MAALCNRAAGTVEAATLRGTVHRIYRRYLLRENPWLQLQGRRSVLFNVHYARNDGVLQHN